MRNPWKMIQISIVTHRTAQTNCTAHEINQNAHCLRILSNSALRALALCDSEFLFLSLFTTPDGAERRLDVDCMVVCACTVVAIQKNEPLF